ncbi:chalcone isomerase family protein [Halomonas sp. 18H]|uniref:chalcone isomerase family protein n=1 Tax=Halomonas almeriensis TaxID=308163 RepID=UPI00222EB636|nr:MULTISPECIES: chalcone isomerase family protein [Halomonas]MCW4151971.1 chalcone isomerase family protein [Halomonas sp. 18H]MDN3552413.1 chalcone isomerase family protein [Halomonas almeriensis]
MLKPQRCWIAALAATLMLVAPPALSVEVEGVKFEEAIEVDGKRYTLLGHGLFRYMVWDAYAGAYYQAEGFPRPAPQSSDVPRRLALDYFHAIKAADFAEVTRDTLSDQLSEAEFSALTTALDDFNTHYRSVEPGDRYVLGWDGQRLTLALNGETLYDKAEATLANALFGIWLGRNPLGEGFRDDLLGR